MTLNKIVSGGQTGVDRGALDAALAAGFPCGGYCPADRTAEDGRIPERYPVTELEGAGYRQRTIQNIVGSDATLIIYSETITGGTKLTLSQCRRKNRPFLLIDAQEVSAARAAERIAAFVDEHEVGVLNVAGPREGKWPGARDFTFEALSASLVRTGLRGEASTV